MQYYVVDAFAQQPFCGNPAGVCVLQEPVGPACMQRIAAENNLSETAFVRKVEGGYALRWFTPKFEIDLCGHATLGTAFVVSRFMDPGVSSMRFFTRSGPLQVERNGELFRMSFPNRTPTPVTLRPDQMEALNCMPRDSCAARDLIVVLENAEAVRAYQPDYAKLRQLHEWLGVAVTARGTDGTDFVSRYFCPELNLEDPVTGSVHCSLIPYWAGKTGKREMTACQLSERGGTLFCELCDSKTVRISGWARLYLQGNLFV